VETSIEPNWTSLLPALVTIVLAFATRQVIVALLAGILTGSVVLFLQTGTPSDLNALSRFLIPRIGSSSYAQILLLYLWCLGGLIGIWTKTGAALHFAERVRQRFAHSAGSSLVVTWLLGVIFHQGGTVSTVLTASTVKPVADANRVSHEELSYVVDSTASPVATLIPLNAWPGYVAGLVAGTIPLIPDESAGFDWFLKAIPYNFYSWIAIISTLLFALGRLPWVGGSMRRAILRARETGALDSPHAEPMLPSDLERSSDPSAYQPSMLEFVAPLATLLCVAVLPFIAGQLGWIENSNWIYEAFALALIVAMLVPMFRGLGATEAMDGFISGCRGMTIGAIVLGLAVTLGGVAKELETASFLVNAIGDSLPFAALPALLTLLCMGIAFSTGTSWGTFAVVFPVALPVAYSLNPDPTFIQICFGSVLGGSVYGDQCSPISDTTILSSMFTGADLMDHVRTQFPLATVAAALGALLSTLFALLS